MTPSKCEKCYANITFIQMPSGARMPVNFAGRVMVTGEGDEQAIDVRKLTTIRGRLIERGREEAEIQQYRSSGRGHQIRFVWINHFTVCSARQAPKPAAPAPRPETTKTVGVPDKSNDLF